MLEIFKNKLKEGQSVFGPFMKSTDPAFVEVMNTIVTKARSSGKVAGTFTDTLQAADMWKKAGVQYISYSVDTGIFTDACSGLVKALRNI